MKHSHSNLFSIWSKRGEVALGTIAVIVGIGALALWLFKPKVLDGDSRRADQVQAANADANAAQRQQGAAAAASVVQIKQAVGDLPGDSPAEDFIDRETNVALSLLPAPDPQALLEAERRRVAIMEGKVEEARKLYAAALKQSQELQAERDAAITRQQDTERALSQVAAERLGAARQRNAALAVGVVLLVLLGLAKWYSVTPGTLGKIIADLKSGRNLEDAFDAHLDARLHPTVNRAFRLNVPIKTNPEPFNGNPS